MYFFSGVYGRQVAVDFASGEWTTLPKHSADLITSDADLDLINRKNYTLKYLGVDAGRSGMHKFTVTTGN